MFDALITFVVLALKCTPNRFMYGTTTCLCVVPDGEKLHEMCVPGAAR